MHGNRLHWLSFFRLYGNRLPKTWIDMKKQITTRQITGMPGVNVSVVSCVFYLDFGHSVSDAIPRFKKNGFSLKQLLTAKYNLNIIMV